MFQRIQSLFLGITLLLMAGLFFLPYAVIRDNAGDALVFNPLEIKTIPEQNAPFTEVHTSNIPSIIIAIGLITCIVALLSFKNRKLQERMVFFAFSSNVLYLVMMVMTMSRSLPTGLEVDFFSAYGMYPALVNLVLLVLAVRAIRKDEALIKSLDRLR